MRFGLEIRSDVARRRGVGGRHFSTPMRVDAMRRGVWPRGRAAPPEARKKCDLRQNLPIFLGFQGSAICAAFTFDVASEAPRPRGLSGLAGGAKFCDLKAQNPSEPLQNRYLKGSTNAARLRSAPKIGVASGAPGPRGLSGPAGGANFCDFNTQIHRNLAKMDISRGPLMTRV